MIIAIQPDDYTDPAIGKCDASSPRWAELLTKAGHEVKWVNVYSADILKQTGDCDGFMWRHGHLPQHRQIARRLLPVLEKELGLETYPDQKTCWHYDDKISQYYLLSATGIPMPRTWIWFDYEKANSWVKTAKFPLVIKLWSGAGSENVRLVNNLTDARRWIKRLFSEGISSMDEPFISVLPKTLYGRLYHSAKILIKGRFPERPWGLHKNYVLFQEFLADNPFDIRIVIIGNRAFAKRRFNRPNDFRASGYGKTDTDPSKINPEAVSLCFKVAKLLDTQSLAFDILCRDGEYVVSEMSYTYPSWSQYLCPGHWRCEGNKSVWEQGQMWPEEAQVEDFLVRLKERQIIRDMVCI